MSTTKGGRGEHEKDSRPARHRRAARAGGAGRACAGAVAEQSGHSRGGAGRQCKTHQRGALASSPWLGPALWLAPAPRVAAALRLAPPLWLASALWLAAPSLASPPLALVIDLATGPSCGPVFAWHDGLRYYTCLHARRARR